MWLFGVPWANTHRYMKLLILWFELQNSHIGFLVEKSKFSNQVLALKLSRSFWLHPKSHKTLRGNDFPPHFPHFLSGAIFIFHTVGHITSPAWTLPIILHTLLAGHPARERERRGTGEILQHMVMSQGFLPLYFHPHIPEMVKHISISAVKWSRILGNLTCRGRQMKWRPKSTGVATCSSPIWN